MKIPAPHWRKAAEPKSGESGLWKKIKEGVGKLPYKYVICLCILGLMGIMLIVFAAYIYLDYQRQRQEMAGREAEHSVERMTVQIDERLDNLKQYYISFVDGDDFKWPIENKLRYSDYTKNKAAQDIMAGKKIFMDYISNYIFVNFDTGWVIGSMGMFPLSQVNDGGVLYDLFTRSEEALDKNYWLYNESPVIERVMNFHYNVNIKKEGISLVMPLSNLITNPNAVFIVNINMNTWKNWINQMLGNCEELVVLSPEGELIYATDSRLVNSCRKQQNEGLTEQKSCNVKIGGVSNYMVSSGQSAILNWEYYIYYDMEQGPFVGARLSGVIVLSILIIVITCFFMTSYTIYRPVGRLVRGVSEEEQKIPGNELEFLASRFADMKNDRQALENVMYQQKEKLLELFELRLIRGEVRSEDEWSEYFEGLQLRQCKYFASAVLVLNLRDESEAQSNVNEDAICLKLVEELPEELKSLTWMPIVYNACAIFCLFGEDDEAFLLERIMKFYDGIQIFAEEHCGYRTLMGVSATHTSNHHIRAAYRESVSALTMECPQPVSEHKTETEDNGVEPGREDCRFFLSSTTVRSNAYNNVYEKEIQNSIKAMDKDQCYKIIDEFCANLRGEDSNDKAMVYILRMVNAILLAGIDTRVDLGRLYPNGLKKVYDEITEVIEPGRVRRQLKYMLIDPVLAARNELLEDSSYSMMQEIENQIRESNGNVTLSECADALGVHPTYIWKILKMEKGKSFSDYLEEYKLEEAMHLLLQTNLSVAEIAVRLNYTNAQNFIRFFSKSTGVTPGKFRKLY
ncbi:MAG TPA: hypothetical protein DCZ91_10755 [Lachnospiraceae bacterium]|nr:hypothetical protein [Lachnospiraceae bacterium]